MSVGDLLAENQADDQVDFQPLFVMVGNFAANGKIFIGIGDIPNLAVVPFGDDQRMAFAKRIKI